MTRGRFAPSPTGHLHLGNARTALVAWAEARSASGTFVMRVEDLDSARTVPEAVEGNLAELRWLGLDWDEGPDVGGPHIPYRQSERHRHYEAALERLRTGGRLFDCYLSRKDLREIASAPHERPAAYGVLERGRNERERAAKIREGKTPSVRFRVDDERVSFEDGVRGAQTIDAAEAVGDFVVRRADSQWAYQLAVVVDDIAMAIDEVVRGDDLLESTAAQLLLYRAFGAVPPRYLHVPLLHDAQGERLAKRRGSLTITELRAAGVPAERVVGLLAWTLGLRARLEPLPARAFLALYDRRSLRREAARLTDASLAWLHYGDAV